MSGIAAALLLLSAQERTQSFDRDPGWDGRNHRKAVPETRELKQDFGWDAAGRVGGFVSPAAEPAYYGKAIRPRGFRDVLEASGRLAVPPGPGNVLLGWFNAGSLNEWRTPNTIAFRINGRGEGFHVHVEYATAKWRAGADFFGAVDPASGRKSPTLFPAGEQAYAWSLRYDPRDGGSFAATFGDAALAFKADPGHADDGAVFDRFGFLNVMKSADGGGSVWLDDLVLDGPSDGFERDPGWEGHRNRLTYRSADLRPQFDFGWSPTAFAGGAAGEIGGLIFRGDERHADRLAYYGDRLEPLSLDVPLRASGRLSFRRGVSDSTVLIGFFHSTESVRLGGKQISGLPENFAGVAIEGPSREGFLFYPAYGTDVEGQTGNAVSDPAAPRLLPDGRPHEWSFEYAPKDGGRFRVVLDGKAVELALPAAHRKIGARFDRFGFVTTHIDGNGQRVYLDDLSYTSRP